VPYDYLYSARERFAAKIDFESSEHWLWCGTTLPFGHGQIYFVRGMLTHRFAWMLYKGAIPEGLQVLHKCDVPQCVKPDHLFLGTQKDNIRDMVLKGRNWHRTKPERAAFGERNGAHTKPERRPHGSRHYLTPFTPEEITEIRARVAAGELQVDIAAEFDVGKTTICNIVHFRNWKKVE